MFSKVKKRLIFRKIPLVFAAVMLAVCCITIHVSAIGLWADETAETEAEDTAKNPPLLVDDAGLLMYHDQEDVSALLEEVSERWNADVVIVTTNTTGGKSAEAYADDYYDYNGYGRDYKNSGILFLVDMGGSQWAFSTTGRAIDAFGDRDLEIMEDEIIGCLSDGEYKTAFIEFADYADRFFEAYDAYTHGNSGLYDEIYTENRITLGVPGKLLIALVIGVIAGFAVAGSMKSKMKKVRPARFAGNYVKRDSMNLSRAADIYLYKHVSKVRIDTDSGGSTHHSGSTHVGSSGVSHGGRSGRF